MGVDMLQNLRAKGAENEELLTGITCRLLRNQAACALKLELWGLATRACDKVPRAGVDVDVDGRGRAGPRTRAARRCSTSSRTTSRRCTARASRR